MKFFVYFISTEISLKQLLQIKSDNLDDEMSFIHLNASLQIEHLFKTFRRWSEFYALKSV